MYHRRVNPEKQFINQVIELSDRLDAVETQPTGIIVVREQIKATNPATGVQTIFGQLDDGDYGIEPFVYDLVPPPIATVPFVSAEPGVFVVSWDGVLLGAIPRDFVCVNIIGHKMSGVTTLSSTAVGTIRNPLDISFISTDVAAIGETWQFSLESEDYRGNKAVWGARSATVTMLSAVSDSGVNAALAALQADADAAALAALNAQNTADTAFNNAATAATAAGLAQTTADGKNRIWYLGTAPAGTEHKQNDIWFNTAADNRVSQWNATGNTWDIQLLGNASIFANLDAGKITVGTLLASVIGAKSITTDKLVITSTDNLIVEADFSNNGSSWEIAPAKPQITINATAGRGSTPAMRITGTAVIQSSLNKVNKVSVGSEDRFRGSIWVKSSFALTAAKVLLRMRCYTTAVAFTDITVASNPLLVINTWTNVAGISPVLPAGTIAVEFFIEVTNNATGTITDINYIGVTRAADGNLVVDGAIDGKVITGASIQTDNTPDENAASRGIKLNTTGLKAYNTLGQKTFDLVASTGNLNVTGTFSSGNAPGTEADAGYTIRAQMGIINFQNWNDVPGMVFEKYNTGTGLTSPSGFIFYYFGGILMRSTVPSTTWVQFKNESYVWVSQDGGQFTSSNSGYVNNGTTESDNLNTRSSFYTRTFPGNSTFNGNDSQMRIGTVAMPTASHSNEWLASWQTRADATYQQGLVLGGVSKWNTTLQVYESRSTIGLHHDGQYYLYGRDTAGTLKSAIVADGSSAGAPFGIEMMGEDIEIRGGVNAITDATRAALILQNGGSWLYGPTRANYFWADATRVGITGNLQINGEANIKHHRAEFTTTNFAVAAAPWDTGPVVADTDANRTRNNDFCTAGPFSGSISFTKAGYYSISCLYIAQGVPGSGWMKLNHSAMGLQGMDSILVNAKHEAYICLPPTYFAVNDYIRTALSVSQAHNGDTRWKVVRSTLNL